MSPPRRYNVLGVGVHATHPAEALDHIASWLRSRRREYVCLAAVHGIMESHRDPALRAIYNAAGLCLPDGMPLAWAGRLQGDPRVARVYGPDLTLALCGLAADQGYSCFFFGGSPGVAERLAEAMTGRFPGLRVVGVASPPFRPLTPAEEEETVRTLNAAAPDVVFVGLGCPKQERWMAAHRGRLHATVLVGVGAAFDFHTGRVRQAPRWMMRAGLEWLFRLSQEPRRLAFRYLVYNPWFVALMALQHLGLRSVPLRSSDDLDGPPSVP